MATEVKIPPLIPPPGKMTYEEFLEWSEEDVRAEWVSGEVVLMGTPSLRHQRLVVFLNVLFTLFVQRRGIGEVLVAPFQMKLLYSGREPDVLFVTQERVKQFKKNYFDGPADLAVEIIGPESRSRDRGEKYYEYEQAGVREYWLLDPDRKQAEFYGLNEQGIYQLLPAPDGIFRSRVLEGFWLKVDWLWQEPLPSIQDVLKELRLP